MTDGQWRDGRPPSYAQFAGFKAEDHIIAYLRRGREEQLVDCGPLARLVLSTGEKMIETWYRYSSGEFNELRWHMQQEHKKTQSLKGIRFTATKRKTEKPSETAAGRKARPQTTPRLKYDRELAEQNYGAGVVVLVKWGTTLGTRLRQEVQKDFHQRGYAGRIVPARSVGLSGPDAEGCQDQNIVIAIPRPRAKSHRPPA